MSKEKQKQPPAGQHTYNVATEDKGLPPARNPPQMPSVKPPKSEKDN